MRSWQSRPEDVLEISRDSELTNGIANFEYCKAFMLCTQIDIPVMMSSHPNTCSVELNHIVWDRQNAKRFSCRFSWLNATSK